MNSVDSAPQNSRWSFAGFRHGIRLGLPVTPGVIAFGLVVGAASARHGLTFLENLAMNALVFSGIAQLVALEAWPRIVTLNSVITVAMIAAVVGARLFLMSVSMRPWFGTLPRWQAYCGLFLLTDSSWLIAMRYHGEGGRDVAVYFGAALMMFVGWLVGAGIGFILGGYVVEPARYGLDLVLLVFFAAMLVPLWGGPRRAIGWIVAGLVAVAVERLLPGWWFIVAGSVCGALAGGYFDEAAE